MKKWLISLFMVCYIPVASADMFGAADSQIILQLTQMLKTAKEQLDSLKSTVDIGKDVRDMESLRVSKELIDTAKDTVELLKEIEETERFADSYFTDRGTSYKQSLDRLEAIEKQMNSANDKSGMARLRSYRLTLESVNRLKMMQDRQKKTMKKLTGKINEGDAAKVTASSTGAMVDLLIERENREAMKLLKEQEDEEKSVQFMNSLGGAYKSLGGEYE